MKLLMKLVKTSAIGACVACLACMGQYYGHTAQQWSQLSAEEKERAAAEYGQLIDRKNRVAHPDSRETATNDFEQRIHRDTRSIAPNRSPH